MIELIYHKCPVNGSMEIEANKPCNWCGKIEHKLTLVVNNMGCKKRGGGKRK